MSGPLVVDASVAYRLILPGQQQAAYRGLVTQWLQEGHELLAPTLWLYELTSALSKAVHFGVLTAVEGNGALALAHALGIALVSPDKAQSQAAYDWTLRLNRAATYDSFYLALAEALGCTLWTADRGLCNAVDQPWVRYAEAA